MANYQAISRTNYFKVTDLASLHLSLALHGVPLVKLDSDEDDGAGANLLAWAGDDQGRVALFARTENGDWPAFDADDAPLVAAQELDVPCVAHVPVRDDVEGACARCEMDKDAHWDAVPGAEDFEYCDDLYTLVAGHLVPGSVAVFVSVGHTKLAEVAGVAHAVNSRGESVTVDLADVYAKAATLGEDVTVF